MTLKKIIPEGGCCPRGYGVAWRSNYGMGVTVYPIPLNLIVRGFLHWYFKTLVHCFPSKYEGELLAAKMRGYQKFREDYNERLIVLSGMEKRKKEIMK